MLEVIIPAYNAHKTIDTTLSSLAMQTARRRMLVTIVDDCSDEGYEDIAARYDGLLNIRILKTKRNGGAGLARNVGIDNALGDYVTFIDADDAFSTPLAISSVMNECYRKWPDIFMARVVQECDNALLLKMDFNSTWIHAKFYRTKFLKDNDLRFPPTRYNEDSAFCTLTQRLAPKDKILQLDYEIYTWINNKASTVRSGKDYYSEHIDDFVRGRLWSYRELCKRGKEDEAMLDAASSLVVLYYMGVDFENGAPAAYDDFCRLTALYAKTIDFTSLLENATFVSKLAENYQKHKFTPRYQDKTTYYFPRIGIIEWYEEIME